MVEINTLFNQGKISRINELELVRYFNFLSNSYKENFAHSRYVLETFPRWSIISGYYAMHDITKLFIARKFRFKVEREVHATTIELIRELIKDVELLKMIEVGYKEFISLVSDLEEAKKERVKAQYYTGTEFMKEEYKLKSKEFIDNIVSKYLLKMEGLLK